MREDVEKATRPYPASIAARGVTPVGTLYPNSADVATRYEILLGPARLDQFKKDRKLRLLDFGCGPGFLLDYLSVNGFLERIEYTGVDVLETMVGHARSRWPGQRFELRDVRDDPFPDEAFDYIIACGVFTVRFENSYDAQVRLVEGTLKALWPSSRFGIGFNVMSKHVDWERDDLFHWPLDDIMAFCKANLSRYVTLRLDYGLWEISALVRKSPAHRQSLVPNLWD